MRALGFVFVLMLSIGCSSNSERIDAIARAASLERAIIEVDGFRSMIYMKRGVQSGGTLVVFLEGDGRPWRDGIEPSIDPTTGNPLALELLTRTPRAAVYVSRPCYQGVMSKRCSPALWTSARYSEQIVRAMSETIREAMRRASATQTILIGHSGGGALAVLIAERLEGIAAVVTIAANLDIDAWTEHHGYVPLTESLNPARSTLPHPWREIHIAGGRDTIVPTITTVAYFERYPRATRWVLEEHTHVCCWRDAWPTLWQRIEAELRVE
jgi:predicted alpha/beta hydrolase family esterase